MTRVATGDVHYAADTVLLHQGRAQRSLVGIALAVNFDYVRAARLLVAHIEYLITRAQMILRGAVASKAPLHLKRFRLVHQRHLVDWSVAGIAADTLRDVNAVIKKDEIGKLIDPRPLQGLSRTITGANRLEQLGISPDLRMAVHAGFRGRDSGKGRSLHGRVAVAAVDTKPGDVMLMAERNRLRLANSRIRDVGRALDCIDNPAQCSHDEDRPKDGGPRQTIRTAMKDLRHSLV